MTDFDTPTGQIPIVIGHRGASGSRPEHTLEAYAYAIEQGADFIEPDLVPTRDGVLIARHENLLASVALDDDGNIVFDADARPVVTQETTNVAVFDADGDGTPDFSDRLTVKVLDGETVGGWFSEDFTLAEIKELGARERIPDVRPGNTAFNDQFEVPTLAEVVRLVQDVEQETGRTIGIYPETKHPTYFALEGTYQNEDLNDNGTLDAGEDINRNGSLDVVNGGERIGIDLSQELIKTLVALDFVDPGRVFIQSFEFANLIALQTEIMPAAGVDLPLVQLYGDVERSFVNENGGGFSVPYDIAFHFEPDNVALGTDPSVYAGFPVEVDADTDYGDLFSAEVLAYISEAYAEGVGPWKNSFLLRVPLDAPVDGNGNGAAQVTTQLTGEVRPFIDEAHGAGLLVHPYTLRNEEPFLTLEPDGSLQTPEEEIRQLIELGADGFFTDYPGTAALVLAGIRDLTANDMPSSPGDDGAPM
jgi:glycerophosphoryl diester phosphodiesterase